MCFYMVKSATIWDTWLFLKIIWLFSLILTFLFMSQSSLAQEKIRSHQTYHSFLFNEQKGQEERKKEKLIFKKARYLRWWLIWPYQNTYFQKLHKKLKYILFSKLMEGFSEDFTINMVLWCEQYPQGRFEVIIVQYSDWYLKRWSFAHITL